MERLLRGHNEVSLRDAIEQWKNSMHIDSKLNEVSVRDCWARIMGTMINRYTEDLTLYKGVLNVRLNSSVLRHELIMMKPSVIANLNKELGSEIIKELIFR